MCDRPSPPVVTTHPPIQHKQHTALERRLHAPAQGRGGSAVRKGGLGALRLRVVRVYVCMCMCMGSVLLLFCTHVHTFEFCKLPSPHSLPIPFFTKTQGG